MFPFLARYYSLDVASGLAPFGRYWPIYFREVFRTSGEATPHQTRFAGPSHNFNTRGFASQVALRATGRYAASGHKF